jgi:hypothetical protein
MSIEKLIKEEEEKEKEGMISGFLEERVCFYSLSGRHPIPFSLSFYLIGNPNPLFHNNLA